MALTAGELQILIDVNTGEIDKLRKKLDDLSGQSKKTQGSFKQLAASFFTAQAAFGLAQKGITILKDELIKSIRVARDFQEANNKFAVTFRTVQKEADNMRKTLVKSYGLSRLEATNLLASTGDLLTGFGFTGDKALDLSNKVQQLSVDLASFQNLEGGAARASEALTKALLGETESAKALGIVIRQTDIVNRLKAQGLDKLTGMELQQAKAEIALQIAVEQSKNAIGDYARTTDSLANRQRTLQATYEDIATSIGSSLLPSVNKLTGGLLESAKGVNEWLQNEDNIKKLQKVIEGVNFAFFIMFKVVSLIIQPFFSFAQNVVIAVKALAGLGEAMQNVWIALTDKEARDQAIKNLQDIGGNFIQLGKDLVDNYKDFGKSFVNAGKDIKKEWTELMSDTSNLVESSITKNTTQLETKGKETGEKIGKSTQDGIAQSLQATSSNLVASVVDGGKSIGKGFGAGMKEGLEGANVGDVVIQIFENVLSTANQIIGSVGEIFNNFYANQLTNLDAFHESELSAIDERLAREIELIENNGITKSEAMQRELEILQEQLEQERSLKEQKNLSEQINELQKQINIRKVEEEASKEKEKADKKYAKKKYNLEVEQFNVAKGLSAAQAGISYAQGLIQAWTSSMSLPAPASLIMGGILTGLLTGIFASQLAAILSKQPPPPPKFQQGTTSFVGGQAIVGDAGAELLTLPRGTRIDNARDTRGALRGGEMQQINLIVDGDILRSWLITNREQEAVLSG